MRCSRCLAVLSCTLLSALRASAAPTDVPSAASFFVPSLPDIHQDPERPLTIFAGHVSSDPNEDKVDSKTVTSHLFFVLVKNRRVADKKRIMFWFNGGPGCSSFDGLMMEVGPWRMDGKGGFNVQEGGWEEYMTMVYVDQPAGTGYSYTSTDKYVHTMAEASTQFIHFLTNFYKIFPEYQNMETYFGGESYAGQWIPYFADAVLNSKLVSTPLHGVAIGNGWMDARRQYPAYIEYAVKMGILEEGSDAWKAAKKRTDECNEELKTITDREPIVSRRCEGMLLDIAKVREKTTADGKQTCINIYDIRLDDTMPACGMNWPPDIHPITTYLDRQDVVHALHAERNPGSWTECRGRIHQEFREHSEESSITVLPKVLAKIPVLIFAGDQDYICNYVGLEAMIQAMEWNGGKGLGTVQTQSWSVADAPAGTWVASRNLTYAKIFNASHMAPFDLPHVSHDMILRFMGVDFSQLLGGSAKIPSSLGTASKPMFLESTAAPSEAPDAGKSPQQAKAMWEAYYNAGSAALVLTVIFAAIGAFVWCRMRRNRSPRLPVERANGEESIPLNSRLHDEDEDGAFRERRPNGHGSAKGKERAVEPGTPIFKVGEDDDEEDGAYRDR
ncbi:Carboxypeptidase [Mycena kentingensis (nom. inval.)]|nr:Carboxypeptidase [Mycena kentingensis (nom. inval.)]